MSITAVNQAAREEAEQIVGTLLMNPPQDPYPLYAWLREIAPMHKASVAAYLRTGNDHGCRIRR